MVRLSGMKITPQKYTQVYKLMFSTPYQSDFLKSETHGISKIFCAKELEGFQILTFCDQQNTTGMLQQCSAVDVSDKPKGSVSIIQHRWRNFYNMIELCR